MIRVELVCPWVPIEVLFDRFDNRFVRHHQVRVNLLQRDRALHVVLQSEVRLFFIFTVSLLYGQISNLLLQLEVCHDALTLESRSALERYRVYHEVALDRTDQVIWHGEFLELYHLLILRQLLHQLLCYRLRIQSLLLRHFLRDLKLIERAELLLHILLQRLVLLSVQLALLQTGDLGRPPIPNLDLAELFSGASWCLFFLLFLHFSQLFDPFLKHGGGLGLLFAELDVGGAEVLAGK